MTRLSSPAPIYHKPTDDEPGMVLDCEKGLFEFSGRSLPENPASLFDPVLEWVRQYVQSPNEETMLHFRLEYFNSSTARFLAEMLQLFEEIRFAGHEVRVCWWYLEEDQMMMERGEELESIVDLEFDYKVFTNRV
jgi:hypothetical protein